MEMLDKYQIINHLGNGAFGDVYLCYDPYLQKEIAVKVIKVPDPIVFENAVKEGQTLDLCKHKHIVEVKDVRATHYQGEPVVLIIMEYLSSGSVEKSINNSFISVKEACKILQQSLLGLEHSHNHNILHRDIKPGNIMFGDNGEAKLSDFGLAIDYPCDISNVTGYMPHIPLEVIEGKTMDKLTDIYASGVTFYRLLNNLKELKFNFRDNIEWAKAVKKNLYPPRKFASHIPDKILKVLNKSMHNNRSSRYQSCLEFRQAIEKVNFYIDWSYVNDSNWSGTYNADKFSLTKEKKRNGWGIDFRRNGIRKTEFCYSNLPDDKVDEEFYKIIRETTLQ